MDNATREDYLTLLSWTGARTQGLGALLLEYPQPAAALAAGDERLALLPAGTQQVLHEARAHWPRRRAPRPGAVSERPAGDDLFLPLHDPAYPAALRALEDPPPWLFCRGDPGALERPAVAIVGSRRASHAGLHAAERLGEDLAGAGYTVCSGLALGIDAAAHRGALRGGLTAAVLASGIDRASPRAHLALAREISRRGCLVTELAPGTPPTREQFPRRNRIISGLAGATIIVEAALPSGTLHTASAALEQGRDVFVLPWSVFHPQGAGCLRLLRDGAVPITDLDELSAFFPALADRAAASDDGCPDDPRALRLLALLGDATLSVETLSRELAIAPGPLLVLLGELEIGGWVQRVGGAYTRRPDKTCQQRDSC